MRSSVLTGLCVMVHLSILASAALSSSAPEFERYQTRPISFTENRGQWDSQVLYRGEGGGAVMWFTNDGVLYQFTRTKRDPSADPQSLLDQKRTPEVEQMLIKAIFVGANANPAVGSEDLMEYKCNFFLGNDSAKWRTDVPNYEAITYRNLYDGIDLKFRNDQGRMVSEIVAAPGADYQQIKVRYEGVKSVSVSLDGELLIETEWGTISEPAPVMFQKQNGANKSIASRYNVDDNQTLRIEITGDFNARSPLLLTPSLTFSTYFGGSGDDIGYDISVNFLRESYITGSTASANFPALTLNAYDNSANGGSDAFVTKFNASGSGPFFSTYLGGSLDDRGVGISLTSSGTYSIFLTGWTRSSNFPTANSIDGTANGGVDVFVATLNSSGTLLPFSTYLGGTGDDYAADIATACGIFDCSVDKYTVWVVGETLSSDFPSLLAYRNFLIGTSDAFLTSYTVGVTGNSMGRSTYFGGSGDDKASAIALVGNNPPKPYITGRTESSDFPLANAYDSSRTGPTDAFITGFAFPIGNGVMYPLLSTYFGAHEGNGNTEGSSAIIIRSNGNICIAGYTEASSLPTTSNSFDSSYNGNTDCFIAEFNSTASALLTCTYLGGASYEAPTRMIEKSGNLYIAGYVASPNFPTVDQIDGPPMAGTVDGFVAMFSPTLSNLLFSTFVGGDGLESAEGLAVDNSGCIYLTGNTHSTNFPVLNPYAGSNSGLNDCFLLKVCLPLYTCGDADRSGLITISDAVYLVSYIFAGGAAPNPVLAGDCDCSGAVNISDVVYLVNYIFSSGPAPCAACP